MKINDEELIFTQTIEFQVLPKIYVDTLIGVTPNVQNVTIFKSHGSPVIVTNFTGGKEGQVINILGNGNTTITNNTNIKTSTGANKVLAADKYYSFMMIDNVWYEHA